MEKQEKIRGFINDNLVMHDDIISFTDDDDIFVKGLVDSLFAMKLITYVEEEFSITIENNEMEISNFSSVERIARFVQNKQNS